MAKLPNVSDAERDVLEALWSAGPSPVRALLEQLAGRWAYTTVQTLLHRLEEKGFVRRARGSGATVYEATLSRDDLLRERIGDLAEDLADGSVLSVVRGLCAERGLTPAEIDEVRAFLDQLEGAPRTRKSKKPTRKDSKRPRGRG
jgi:predicted transcriptional regulator